ncbi:MAG: YraN family protein [bacterium]|nr:YraN family protein [bacterium]
MWDTIIARFKRTSADNDRIAIGKYGEHVAVEHLKEKGFQIIARNWRCFYGEIDIIARDKTELAFIEVKTRRNTWTEFWSPESAVDENKRRRLRRLAQCYIARNRNIAFTEVRFDIISVVLTQRANVDSITHIPDAF